MSATAARERVEELRRAQFEIEQMRETHDGMVDDWDEGALVTENEMHRLVGVVEALITRRDFIEVLVETIPNAEPRRVATEILKELDAVLEPFFVAQPCKTCGGSKEVPIYPVGQYPEGPRGSMYEGSAASLKKPCPECGEQSSGLEDAIWVPEEPCKTCGGSEKVPTAAALEELYQAALHFSSSPRDVYKMNRDISLQTEPCPDCQKGAS